MNDWEYTLAESGENILQKHNEEMAGKQMRGVGKWKWRFHETEKADVVIYILCMCICVTRCNNNAGNKMCLGSCL
jgi:hypothetical protein